MKAVIKVGGKQYIVAEKQTLLVDKLEDAKELSLEPLMVFDDKTAKVGTPVVKGASVSAKVVEPEVKGEKLRVVKFQAKKRVKKMTGHRQKYAKIEITKITA
ncbi:MAG TPA: 50S ribosomal protein L21 [Candidatus Saccharimonadales bacterium]|nr:50S ribosomal protein L21 [Candidatus Saccharimonadales bacterium]